MDGIRFYLFKIKDPLRKVESSFFLLSILIFILIFVFETGCINFKIKIPAEPDLILDYISIVKTVNENRDFSMPLKDDFIKLKENRIYAVVKAKNIGSKLDLIWMWYDPDKNLVKKSDKITVNKGGIYLEYFIGWDSLKNIFFNKKAGEWTVVIKSDNVLIGERKFKVNKSSGKSK